MKSSRVISTAWVKIKFKPNNLLNSAVFRFTPLRSRFGTSSVRHMKRTKRNRNVNAFSKRSFWHTNENNGSNELKSNRKEIKRWQMSLSQACVCARLYARLKWVRTCEKDCVNERSLTMSPRTNGARVTVDTTKCQQGTKNHMQNNNKNIIKGKNWVCMGEKTTTIP